ncbi:MAG: TlpA disulfide reductase family protein [Verrucomicrobiales bacterium]|nr:TlpA disulfide reductase family protein [Verrucomicrobiales bacterium]
MKTTLLFPALILSTTFLSTGAFAESAKSIFETHETQKAEALAAYLEGNPEAEDGATAESMLIGAYMQLDQAEKAAPLLRKRYDSLSKGADANLQELIPGVIEPLFRVYSESGDKDAAREFVEQAKKDLGSHPQGPQIMQFFDGMLGQLAMPGVGDAMAIKFTSTDGKEIDLAAMKDKVVLVDFWATWCGPCVAEMPHVISTYEKHKEAGFEVVGISLDSDRSALDAFLAENEMTWPQYFDGEGWGNKIAKEFGITGIPATFLLGKDGKIAATNLRGNALEETVAGLLE